MWRLKKLAVYAIPVLILLGIFTAKDIRAVQKTDMKYDVESAKYEVGSKVQLGNLVYQVEGLYQTKILDNENLIKEESEKAGGPNGIHSLVNSVRANDLHDFVGKDNYFLIVKLKVTNINTENGYRILPSMFSLVMSDQTLIPVHKEATACFKDYGAFFQQNIDPEKSQTGYVAFLVQDLEAKYAIKMTGGNLSVIKELVYFKDEEILDYIY